MFFVLLGVEFRSYADWLARHQYVISVIWRRKAREGCFARLTRVYGLFVRRLISSTNAYAGCSRPTLNAAERFVLGRSIPTAKPLHLASVGRYQNRMYKDLYVELFSMNVNLNVFCIICLCIILCATRKASENLTFVLKQSLTLSGVFAVIIICCLAAMKIKDCRTNYIRFISKL